MKRRHTKIVVQDDDAWFDDMRQVVSNDWARLNSRAAVLDDEGKRLCIPAPNAIEWVVGERWCNSPSTYEYSGQYEAILEFFELLCPICNTPEDRIVWGKSRESLGAQVLLVWDHDLQEDVCPKCDNTRSDFVEDGYFNSYNTMHYVVGQRGGKSVMAGLVGTYIEHRYHTLGLSSPGGFGGHLGLTMRDPFEMTFLAATAVQSSDTVWAKFTAARAESPWFQRFIPWIKKQEVQQVVPAGMKPWVYRETDNRIVNQHPSLRLIVNSMNSNAPGLRGRTRVAAFADEISHMEQTESKRSATEIYRALERSLRTVRTRTKLYGSLPWLGAMVSVTSPVSREDKGMLLLKDARKVKTMLAKQLPTWEFNPHEPREAMQDEFDKDPVGAERDYGANPPGAAYPLIHDEARWRVTAVDTSLKPRADFEVYEVIGETGQPYMAVKVTRAEFMKDRFPRFIVWDAGKNFDAFAGACAHGEWVEDEAAHVEPGQAPQLRLITVFDWVVRILPRHGTEVMFDRVRDVMDTLRKNMHIGRCEFDRWQSVQLIQQIREMGIFAEQKSTTDADYVQWRADCANGKVRMLPPNPNEYDPAASTFIWTVEPPDMSAQACAIYELLGAQCDLDSHKITFPSKGDRRGYGSNDTGQCIVHAHALVQRQHFTEKQDDRSRRAARLRLESTGLGWESRGGLAGGTPAAGRTGPGSNRRGW